MLTLGMLEHLWPHGNDHVPGLREGLALAADRVFAAYFPIDTRETLVAHFMAQASHECGAGLEMIENMNYSATGLRTTWPTRFTLYSARKYAHNPQMIADSVYGGRMGNRPPPATDGWDFRGHGLTQTTGRGAYMKLGAALDVDLVDDPDWVNEPGNALIAGVVDFVQCGCLTPASKDDIVGVTRELNGGLIGLADRRQWLVKWKVELGATGP